MGCGDKDKRTSVTDTEECDKGPATAPKRKRHGPKHSYLDGNHAPATPEETAKPEETGKPAIPVKNKLELVKLRFTAFIDDARDALDVLQHDLGKADEVPWYDRLLGGLVDVALLAGAAACGELVAVKLIEEGADVAHEFVKAMFEEGINAGVEAGREGLEKNPSDKIFAFIMSHKRANRKMHEANQAVFTLLSQDQVTNEEDADKLLNACDDKSTEAAAKAQSIATRNAWVSYLAQAKFGAKSAMTVTPIEPTRSTIATTTAEPTTTNMMHQWQRDEANKGGDDAVASEAPNITASLHGESPGVLTLMVTLPAIDGLGMHGRPRVKYAFLNGVNDAIRDQYAGQSLSACPIPRQIFASVDGESAPLTFNIDERGVLAGGYVSEEGSWLRLRAMVGHPENADALDDFERAQTGLELLLAELVPKAIHERWMTS